MDELLLLLLAVVVLAGLVVALVRLFDGLRKADDDRRRLAWRLTDLERRLAAGVTPPDSTPAAQPPTAPVSAKTIPAEDDYAAAEEELRAAEADRPAEPEPAATAEPESEAERALAAQAAARPTPPAEEPVPAPRPAHAPREDGGLRGARRPAALSFEDFLGGRVLLVVGVIVVLFALGFFLKYAIEQDLIDERLRVAVGVVSGLAALVGGDVLRRRGFDVFGHAVMGGGLGALFLSTFFAAVRYDLIGRPVAFGVTAAIAVAGLVVALRREAPLLAYLGLLGGYAAPTILGEGRDALEGLTGWLLALHVGVLVVLWLRRWPGLDLMALAASVTYYGMWADHFAGPGRLGAAAWSLAALTALILAFSLAPGLARRRALMPTSLVTAILAGAAAVTAGFELFALDHRYALGAGISLLALVYVGCARFAVGRVQEVPVDRPVLDGCAVAAVAAAIPTFLEGAALAPAWAAAGAVAMFLAGAHRSALVLTGGLVMIGLAQWDLLDNHAPMHQGPFLPFVNGAFLAWASPSVALVIGGLALRLRSPLKVVGDLALGAGAWLYFPVLAFEVALHFGEDSATYGVRNEQLALSGALGALAVYAAALAIFVRRRRPVGMLLPLGPLTMATLLSLPTLLFMDRRVYVPVGSEVFAAGLLLAGAWWACTWAARGTLRAVLLIGSVLVGLYLIGSECWAYQENASVTGTSQEELERISLVWMSVSFALYAALLLGVGFARRVPALRWSGLAIFLVTLVKVFVVDLSQLPTVHRIGGFLVLGLALLGASFLYQRARRDGEPEPDVPAADGEAET